MVHFPAMVFFRAVPLGPLGAANGRAGTKKEKLGAVTRRKKYEKNYTVLQKIEGLSVDFRGPGKIFSWGKQKF